MTTAIALHKGGRLLEDLLAPTFVSHLLCFFQQRMWRDAPRRDSRRGASCHNVCDFTAFFFTRASSKSGD